MFDKISLKTPGKTLGLLSPKARMSVIVSVPVFLQGKFLKRAEIEKVSEK